MLFFVNDLNLWLEIDCVEQLRWNDLVLTECAGGYFNFFSIVLNFSKPTINA